MAKEPTTSGMSFGEKAVGAAFNPSGDDMVGDIKAKYADLINILHAERSNPDVSNERARLCSIAITEAQSAQMWAVKAVTWKDD